MVAPASTTSMNRSGFNGCDCDKCGLIRNQFLSNYSSESCIASDSEEGDGDCPFNNTQSRPQSDAMVSAATAIVTTNSSNNQYGARATTTDGPTTMETITKNDNCDNIDKLCINGIFERLLKCYLFDILPECLFIVIALSFLSIILLFIFHILIFYECIFYYDNVTICLIIHDLNGNYFYTYQLLKLFIFVAIYGATHMVASASNSRETSDRHDDHDPDYGDIEMDMEIKINDSGNDHTVPMKKEVTLITQDLAYGGKLFRIDFGLAITATEANNALFYSRTGLIPYTAPEIVLSRINHTKGYLDSQVDIWSAGIVLYIMFVGSLVFFFFIFIRVLNIVFVLLLL